ncbi:MAG: MarR family winged helix-turn-helix transcriptional regulator [Faecousia sp.]
MVSRYESFSACISCMYHDIQKIERAEMAKYGLKGPHAQCLLAMSRYPEGITSARLCEVCEKDKAAISRIVAELEQMGMVRRTQHNGTRYRASLTLTEQGRTAAQTVDEKARLAVERAGAGLDDESRQVFYSVLALIAGNLHTICKNGLTEEV